jgi:hypothetical protein
VSHIMSTGAQVDLTTRNSILNEAFVRKFEGTRDVTTTRMSVSVTVPREIAISDMNVIYGSQQYMPRTLPGDRATRTRHYAIKRRLDDPAESNS